MNKQLKKSVKKTVRVSQKHHNILKSMVENKDFKSLDDATNHIIDSYLKGDCVVRDEINVHNFNICDKADIDEIETALKNGNLSFKELVRESILAKAKVINKAAQTIKEFKDDPESLKLSNIKGAASVRIDNKVREIIKHNDKVFDQSKRICITKGIIFKLTGSNYRAINKYFESHNKAIESHNNKYQLSTRDNSKGRLISIEQLLIENA